MQHELVISGFGGQGALFAGQVLAYAAMDSGLHVTWLPSYGPEMRGGTAHCIVVISDEPIGAPLVQHPSIAVVMNNPSLEKYAPLVKPGGLLVVNQSLAQSEVERDDIEVVMVPAQEMAEELGSPKMLNVVLVGAVLARRPVMPLSAVEQALIDHLPAKRQNLLEANRKALKAGYDFASVAASHSVNGQMEVTH